MAVLQVVDVHLAAALPHQPGDGAGLRAARHHHPRQQLGQGARLLVGEPPRQRHQHMQAARAAGLQVAGQRQFLQQVADFLGRLDHVLEGGVLGVQIQNAPVWVRQVVDAAVPSVDRNGAEVGEVLERRGVFRHEVVHVALLRVGPQRGALHPLGGEVRRVPLIEGFAVDAIREPRQHQRALAQIGQHPRRDALVVIHQIALGASVLREERLVAVGHHHVRRRVRGGRDGLQVVEGAQAVRGRLVVAQAQEGRQPQVPTGRILLEGHFADEFAGHPADFLVVGQGRALGQRRQPLLQLAPGGAAQA